MIDSQHLTPSVNHDGHVRVKHMSSKHNVKIPTTRLHAAQQAPYGGRGLRINTVERPEKTDIIQQSGIPDGSSGSMQNCIPICYRLKSRESWNPLNSERERGLVFCVPRPPSRENKKNKKNRNKKNKKKKRQEGEG